MSCLSSPIPHKNETARVHTLLSSNVHLSLSQFYLILQTSSIYCEAFIDLSLLIIIIVVCTLKLTLLDIIL